MKRHLFGTDGVRGLAGQYPLDAEGARRIGLAVGTLFAGPDQTVVIGCDPRESSTPLVNDLAAGLAAAGASVKLVGVITTPGLAYLTRENDFAAGVMVTASHNPYQYNGVKVFDFHGDKLSDETEAKLNRLIEDDLESKNAGSIEEDHELIKQYEDFLVALGQDLRLHQRIAIDMANGSASGLAARVFKRLGSQLTPLFDKPDGRNINDGCGATDIKALQAAVIEQGLDLGIALDGDADRLIMVDNLGREVKGDYLLYILAVTEGLDGVVATVMSNLGFEKALNKQNIKLKRTQVGDRYVLEALRQSGYQLGGEQSGHIIFPQLLKTGDGLLAAVQVLEAIEQSGKTLAAWCDEVELLPQALVNIGLPDKSLLERPIVKDFIAKETELLNGSGRLLIRPSGTEPLARVMVEAPYAQAVAEKIADQLQQIINKQEAADE
jgi:phosphoglucosamine mutase